MNTGFLGRDGFIWFVGVVEDRYDPNKLGRVRVRCLGYHTHEKEEIATADLPWAEVMQPVGANAIGGIGDSPIGIVEGSWVVGFFRDPEHLQEPIIMGTLPGKNTRPATPIDKVGVHRGTDNIYGFYDPTDPLSDVPFEPDISTTVGEGSGGTVTAFDKIEDLRVLSYAEADSASALSTGSATVSTHSQGLFDTFGTTRRLTIPIQKDSGEDYGTASASTVWKGYKTNAKAQRKGKVISTGYLEDGDTRDATNGPWWPETKDAETRVPYPRLEKVAVSTLTTKQKDEIQALFDDGVYGPGKTSTKVNDLKEVVLPKADTNRLAQGGYAISSISSGGAITLKSYKVDHGLSAGDKVQVAGVVGMETLNGQIFTLVSAGKTSLQITIPASEKGTYVRGGAVLVDPHPVLRSKSDTRERQINIGGEDLNSRDDEPEYLDDGKYTGYWNQPSSRYAAEYPYNHVYESESGHVKEFDDTPGAERIHEYHRSGTYYEVDADGHKVDYVKGDRYNISVHDDYLYVKGHVIWTGDNDMLIASNETMSLTAKWRMKIASGGDIEVYSKRNLNFRADGDINMVAGGHIKIEGEVTKSTDKSWAHSAGTRSKETPSRISMTAGTMEFYVPAPEVETLPQMSHGRIDFNAHHRISMKVQDGFITREAPGEGAIIDTAAGIYFNSEHEKKSPADSFLARDSGIGIGQGYGADGAIGKAHIAYTLDDVKLGTTGQGSGLGIDDINPFV